MTSKRPKRRTFGALLRTTLREEWGIWLTITILLLATFLFSNQFAAWLEKSAFIKVLDSLSKLGVLIAAIAFLREIPKWEERAEEEAKRRRFEYWKAVDSANTVKRSGEGRFFSTALKIALEELAKEKDTEGEPIKLTIDADGAKLEDINLEGAYLYVCGLDGADLRGAKGITVGQIKESKNWEHAIYDDEFRKELGLLP